MQHQRLPSADGSSSVLSLTQSIRWWDTDDVEITSEKMRMAAGLEALEKPADPLQRRRQEEHVLRILAENEMLRSTVSAYR
jgi:hypothetical protein